MTTSSVVVQVEHSTHAATSTLTKEAVVDADVLFLYNAPTYRVFVLYARVLGDVDSLQTEYLFGTPRRLLRFATSCELPQAVRSLEKKRPVAQVNLHEHQM